MGLSTSSYETLVRLKARYQIQKDPVATLALLERRYNKRRSKKEQLRLIYGYVAETHNIFYNKAKAPSSHGCGCHLCMSLHNYAKLKLERHYFKATFYKESSIRYSDPDSCRHIPVDFDAEYDSYSKECDKTKEVPMSEHYYYEKRMADYDRRIKQLRVQYKSIQDTINSVLSS